MRYWWVNHSQTFDHEVGKGYVWCPKRKRNGAQNHFYETLREVQQGDLAFSYGRRVGDFEEVAVAPSLHRSTLAA
jgi:hypothetical protein